MASGAGSQARSLAGPAQHDPRLCGPHCACCASALRVWSCRQATPKPHMWVHARAHCPLFPRRSGTRRTGTPTRRRGRLPTWRGASTRSGGAGPKCPRPAAAPPPRERPPARIFTLLAIPAGVFGMTPVMLPPRCCRSGPEKAAGAGGGAAAGRGGPLVRTAATNRGQGALLSPFPNHESIG